MPNRITFEILWYYSGGPDYAPNRCIGRDYVNRHDLTDAITTACNLLKSGKGRGERLAHGFYVRAYRGVDQVATTVR